MRNRSKDWGGEVDGMSLTRQLWLAIGLLMVIAFAGSFFVSSLSAKAYLGEQLRLKNADNANSLALVLTQQSPKDAVEVELTVSSQFDLGNYEYIRLTDPRGQTIAEQVGQDADPGAPGWFIALLPIEVPPGVAQVQDGWNSYGTLEVASHKRFAYGALWSSSLRMLAWFLAAAVVAGIAGTVLLRLILRPLDDVVDQAEAIGARRFITTPEPGTLEFQTVVRSMNTLAKRVRHMLEEESLRLDQLRREAHYDQVSAMLNRTHFVARVQAVLEREDEAASGSIVIARLMELNELNRNQGWAVVDSLIRRFADRLREMAPREAEWVYGRLNGSDFAVLAPGNPDTEGLARQVGEAIHLIARELDLSAVCQMPTAGTPYAFGEKVGAVLSRVDAALQGAVEEGGNAVRVAGRDTERQAGPTGDLGEWRRKLDAALTAGYLKLLTYPVADASGAFLHGECVARLRLSPDGDWLQAGEFMPWLSRLGFSPRLDEMVVDLALERLRKEPGDLCINLSAQAMNDALLVHRLANRLGQASDLARRLWIEVPEHGAFQHLEHFRILCALLKPTGCRLGIEHVGHQVSRIGELHDLGLDYMKIDASFVRGLDENHPNQVFLRGLAIIAHSIGLSAIGEGARSEQEVKMLVEMGFDGVTGPAVTLRGKEA